MATLFTTRATPTTPAPAPAPAPALAPLHLRLAPTPRQILPTRTAPPQAPPQAPAAPCPTQVASLHRPKLKLLPARSRKARHLLPAPRQPPQAPLLRLLQHRPWPRLLPQPPQAALPRLWLKLTPRSAQILCVSKLLLPVPCMPGQVGGSKDPWSSCDSCNASAPAAHASL